MGHSFSHREVLLLVELVPLLHDGREERSAWRSEKFPPTWTPVLADMDYSLCVAPFTAFFLKQSSMKETKITPKEWPPPGLDSVENLSSHSPVNKGLLEDSNHLKDSTLQRDILSFNNCDHDLWNRSCIHSIYSSTDWQESWGYGSKLTLFILHK